MQDLRLGATDALKAVHRFWHDEDAVTSAEYVFLLCVLSLGSLVAFGHLSDEVSVIVRKGSDVMEQAAGMGCWDGR